MYKISQLHRLGGDFKYCIIIIDPGPEILDFLKKRHVQKLKGSQPCEGDKEKMAVLGEARNNEGRKRDNEAERSHPGRWLHMDVVEKDKIEWMTDVPLYRQETSSDQQPKEVRFSLDGLVIHRNVILPVHLGLHHHGDEPQVSGIDQSGYIC